MTTTSNNRTQQIKLIHVAKRSLQLNEEAYRSALIGATGKESCTEMTDKELDLVINALKAAGFKKKTKKNSTKRMSPASDEHARTGEITKIRAIWITMHQQDFIRDGSETALNSYVHRQTSKTNDIGVNEVSWLDAKMAYAVLESLKQWHCRLMIGKLVAANEYVPMQRSGSPAGYDAICQAYDLYIKKSMAVGNT